MEGEVKLQLGRTQLIITTQETQLFKISSLQGGKELEPYLYRQTGKDPEMKSTTLKYPLPHKESNGLLKKVKRKQLKQPEDSEFLQITSCFLEYPIVR